MLLGLVGMIDPPRTEAKAAVTTAKRAHIRTVMITGDHPATAEAIARELTSSSPARGSVTGTELRTMDDAELDAIVEDVRVFARVDPEHKLRIVGALQRKGHIVAMTGDGINDAPALKAANIGVAMGITGTDVSKEAADMVLTDDNFASIVKAIEEGRGIYDNIRKYLIYLLSSNAGELLTMFAGVMFAGLLGLISAEPGLFLPLLAAQLLWINLITDGPPALALGVDPKDPDVMEREPRARGTGVLTTEDWWRLGAIGLVMMVGTVAVLDAYYPGGLFTLFATRHGTERGRRGLRTHDGVHHADDVPALQRVQLPLELAQRLQRILRQQVAPRCGRAVAVHACARDLRAVPADGVPHRAADGIRLAGRDRRRIRAAHRHGAVQIRVANGTSSRTWRGAKDLSRRSPFPRVRPRSSPLSPRSVSSPLRRVKAKGATENRTDYILLCTNAPMRSMAARTSGRTRSLWISRRH